MDWTWAIGLPLFAIVEAAAKNQRNLMVVREIKKNTLMRYKTKGAEVGTIAVEVNEGKITDIWLIE